MMTSPLGSLLQLVGRVFAHYNIIRELHDELFCCGYIGGCSLSFHSYTSDAVSLLKTLQPSIAHLIIKQLKIRYTK